MVSRSKARRAVLKRYLVYRHLSITNAAVRALSTTLPKYVPSGRRSIFLAGSQCKGAAYTPELLEDEANPHRIFNLTRLRHGTFHALVQWLQENTLLRGRRLVSIEEKVLIFLAICAQGMNWRMAAELFGHSLRTINVYALQICLITVNIELTNLK